MKSTSDEQSKKFRRLVNAASHKDILVPHLEMGLLLDEEKIWPEEYVIKVHNKERKWDGMFHPSSDCAPGDLELFFKFNPKTRDLLRHNRPSVDTIMTWQIGSAIHAVVQSMIINMGFTKEEECEVTYVSKERNSTGTIDIRNVWLPGESEPIMVDIKSAAYLPPKNAQYSYQQQLQVYMDIGDKEPRERGLILYVEKAHPHRMKEFVIRRDEKMLNEIYGKWSRVLEAIEFNNVEMLQGCCMKPKTCAAAHLCPIGGPMNGK